MGRGRITVYLFTLLFAAAAVVLWAMEPRTEAPPVDLAVSTAGDEKILTCWENEAGEYFLFLPGYADPASTRLRLHARDVRIDGSPAREGMSLEGFALDTPYAFSFLSGEGEIHTSLTIFQSQGMPALFIDSGSGSMAHIHAKKGNAESGRMSLYLPDGELALTGNLDEIKGRGNDWMIPKKSYSLQLAAPADLLGMGQAEKWILQANAFDGSHLRNRLIYEFADALGLAYSPESRWVDLYLNGEYAGLYLLCERNEIQEQRVSLEEPGSYLVSMDVDWRLEQNEKPFVTTQAGYAFRIQDYLGAEAVLQQRLQSVENALAAEDGRDPLTGKHWSELIDTDSWARKILVEEIFGNGDGGAISQYFYGNTENGPMYAGPVWDYDISMGNSQAWRVREPQTLFAERSRMWSQTSISWYNALYRREDFRDCMTKIYREDCLPLLETFLQERMAEYTGQIAAASAMNQHRWETLWACRISAAEETENIRSYMQARIAFLNQLWLEQEQFCNVLVDANDGGFTVCFAVRPGEQLPGLPEYEPSPEILGWYAAGSEEPFDITQPIQEDMEIVLRRAEPEPVEEAPAEPETGGRRVPLQYIPFLLLLGILVIFGFLDGRHGKNRGRNNHSLIK